MQEEKEEHNIYLYGSTLGVMMEDLRHIESSRMQEILPKWRCGARDDLYGRFISLCIGPALQRYEQQSSLAIHLDWVIY